VLTSLHSDDSQIASRMNWEAAKLLRTGLTEEQALALVTINPARIIGIATASARWSRARTATS
jgi:imidazolonepropionase-like amidohydrolase